MVNQIFSIFMQPSDDTVLRRLLKAGTKGHVHRLRYNGRQVRYVSVGDRARSAPLVVFIHGAPGSCAEYLPFLANRSLQKAARLIAVDRPGYGQSDYGRPLTSIQAQADCLAAVLGAESAPASKVLLVGHSYGGPIAAQIAIDHPQTVSHLLLLAPAISPADEVVLWVAYLTKFPLVQCAISRALQVAAHEKFAHKAELRKLLPKWERLQAKTCYVHGTADWIVPYRNMAFARRNLPKERTTFLTLTNVGHILQFTHRKMIEENVLELLNR